MQLISRQCIRSASLICRRMNLRWLSEVTRRFATDERGSIAWIGLILMTVVTAIGAIVGLSTYRDHLLQQFGDASVGLRNIRQVYKYEVQIDANMNGIFGDREDCVLTGSFSDVVDLEDNVGEAPACMQLAVAPTNEQ